MRFDNVFPCNRMESSTCKVSLPIDMNNLIDLYFRYNAKSNRRKRAYGWNRHVDDFVNGVSMERTTCRARYQQSPVEVYARFLAIDQVNVHALFSGQFNEPIPKYRTLVA